MSAISRKHFIDPPLDLRPAKRVKHDFDSAFSMADYHFLIEEYEESLAAFLEAADLATDENEKENALFRAGEVVGLLYASSSGYLGLTAVKLERILDIFDQLFALGDPMARWIKKDVFVPWFKEVLTFHDVKTKEEVNQFLRQLKPLLPLPSGQRSVRKVSAYLKETFSRAELLSVGMTWVADYVRVDLNSEVSPDIRHLRAALPVLQVGLEEVDWRVATDSEKDAFFSHLFARFVAFPDEKPSSCFSFISGAIPAHAEFDVEMEALSLFCDRFFNPQKDQQLPQAQATESDDPSI